MYRGSRLNRLEGILKRARDSVPQRILKTRTLGRAIPSDPLGPSGFEGAQHRQTLRASVDGVRCKVLRPFGLQ